ncbi:MAG: ribonuclease P protein subunit [Thaumarchaeota archaeon]|nr:ribonuclease P protein subunit [Nitrososphaerota archaeon]
MITSQNITQHELIGLYAKISHSTNPQVIGLNGVIIDETKSMLKMSCKDKTRSLPKDTSVWEFATSDGMVCVYGKDIAKRSADRLRRKA